MAGGGHSDEVEELSEEWRGITWWGIPKVEG